MLYTASKVGAIKNVLFGKMANKKYVFQETSVDHERDSVFSLRMF